METTDQIGLLGNWLIAEWSAKMCGVVETMADAKPSIGRACAVPDPAGPPSDTPVWRQNFAISPRPGLWIATPLSTSAELGHRTLAAAGVDSSDEADAQSTFGEILSQSLSALGQSIGAQLGCDAAASEGEQVHDVPPGLEWHPVHLEFDKPLEPFWLAFAPALLERLAAGASSSEDLGEQDSPGAVSQLDAALPSGGRSKTFDLLLDVALPVSISFGRTFLPIKDVLKLTTGSIVELDRAVNEPVDVIVNNCVIARGEVVVVEGNYGVRILQIASRYERLRTGSASAQVQHALMGN